MLTDIVAGDIIGAAFNLAEHTISYFKNGFEIGVAFANVPEEELYPTVGLRSPDEEVGPAELGMW